MTLFNTVRHDGSVSLQYKLKVARSEGSEAQRRAVEASSSYKTASEQLAEEQRTAAEAASTAAGAISDLQVGNL